MFKQLIVGASLAFVALAAHADVIAPTLAFSSYNHMPDGTVGPQYAGDAAQGEISRIYNVFDLPTAVSGTAVASASFSIDVFYRYNSASNPLGLYSVTADPTTSTGWSTITGWAVSCMG